MNSQGLLLLVLITGLLYFSRVTANMDQFPQVSYKDIELLNATCKHEDNCTEERWHDSLNEYNCNCDAFCSKYDTCCVDSQYRDKGRKVRKPYSCVKIYGTKVSASMIDTCDPTWSGDNHTEELCKANANEQEDLFLAVPVTNNKTGNTYRNYFCAVCNYETDADTPTPWDLSLTSKSEEVMSTPLPELHFISSPGIWIIGNETENLLDVKVTPIVKVPDEVRGMVHDCKPNIISRCASDWNYTIMADKCAAYMAITRVYTLEGRKMYRNPHCAICNYVSLEDSVCSHKKFFNKQKIVPRDAFFVRLFSSYNKENKCGDHHVYDPIAKKCRKVFKS